MPRRFKLKLKIYGRVQGVGYRKSIFLYVQKEGQGLVGYVQNLDNGTVEVVAVGEEAELEKLEKFCWRGPLLASVTKIERQAEELTSALATFQEFSIRR